MVSETVCLAIPDESLSLRYTHTNLSYLTVINTNLLANDSVGEMQCLCVHWHLMKWYLNDSLPSPLLFFFFFSETGFYSPLTPDILGPACQVLVSWPVPLCPQDEHSVASVRGRLTHLPVATVLLLLHRSSFVHIDNISLSGQTRYCGCSSAVLILKEVD